MTIAHAWLAHDARAELRIRTLLQTLLFVPFVRALCRPLRAEGRDRVPDGAVIFVANHASHADTAAIVAALPRRARARLAPAAAEDYFFGGRLRGAICRALTGAFPFPRRGTEGLRRAAALLARDRAVLLFPEGTRSRTGAIAPFRPGAALLATRYGHGDAVVVPVGVAGTRDVLGVGAKLPRRAAVAVVFGEPLRFEGDDDPAGVTATLEAHVKNLAARARAQIAPPRERRTWYARAHALAMSPRGLALAFAWGVAEAIAWPIVPDAAIALLAMAAPRRFLAIAAAALCGSMLGGAIAYGLGAVAGTNVLPHLPLVTPRMQAAALGWLHHDGGWALWHQFRFGVPYKTFAWQAAGAGAGLGELEAATLVVRGFRMLIVGALFAGVALPWRRWADRLYVPFAALFAVAFAMGLARIVARWS